MSTEQDKYVAFLKKEAKKQHTKEKNMKSGLKLSGFILEEIFEIQHPEITRLPEKSDFDFEDENRLYDIKGCLASKYNGNIFIEIIQNKTTLSSPAYTSYSGDKEVILVYIDYDTGIQYNFNWTKLKKKITYKKTVDGGYHSVGILVGVNEFPECMLNSVQNEQNATKEACKLLSC